MNGPEHYAKAEQCFAESDQHGPSYEDAGLWLDLGHGHALLAIASLLAEHSRDPRWTPLLRPRTHTNDDEPAENAAYHHWGPA